MKKLISKAEIDRRVAELGAEIDEYYQDKFFTVIILLNGAFIFGADLLRAIKSEKCRVDTLALSSYSGRESSGELNFRSALKLDIKDKNLLIIDDIFDSGLTLSKVMEYLKSNGASSVNSCVLLKKRIKRSAVCEPTWCGFETGDEFIVGYGLDDDERYRNLPEIFAV